MLMDVALLTGKTAVGTVVLLALMVKGTKV